MPNGFPYLINEKLIVNGKKIFCKVTGLPNSAKDGQPYVLVISGGPGFGHEVTELHMKRLIPVAEQDKLTLPHFIFFDNLGCGQSEKASDPNKEYTVDFFTDLSADLVTVVKEKLGLLKMNLCVEGGSFGSLIAMNFPARKPKWLESNSDIQLLQIVSKVGPNGVGMEKYTLDFLKEYHSKHFNYDKMVAAQKKLFTDGFKNQADYVQNFVLPMATLYVANISSAMKTLLMVAGSFPSFIVKTVDWLDWACQFCKTVEELQILNHAIGKCAIDVLSHFFKNDLKQFNLIKVIEQHKDLYAKIPITLIAAGQDHIVDYRISEAIHNMFPKTSALIVFKGAHMINKGENGAICNQLNYSLFVSRCFKDKNHAVFQQYEVPQGFQDQLSKIKLQIDSIKEKSPVAPTQQASKSGLFANSASRCAAAVVGATVATAAAVATVTVGLAVNSYLTGPKQ